MNINHIIEKVLSKKCILITGPIGAGKTTLSQSIKKYSNHESRSFANKLREITSVILGIEDKESLKDQFVKTCPGLGKTSIRDTMIHIATSIRQIDDQYFVRDVIRNDEDKIIIDDLRFQIELNYARQIYGDENIYILYLNTDPCFAHGNCMHDVVRRNDDDPGRYY